MQMKSSHSAMIKIHVTSLIQNEWYEEEISLKARSQPMSISLDKKPVSDRRCNEG
jgi:hypothetical protein